VGFINPFGEGRGWLPGGQHFVKKPTRVSPGARANKLNRKMEVLQLPAALGKPPGRRGPQSRQFFLIPQGRLALALPAPEDMEDRGEE